MPKGCPSEWLIRQGLIDLDNQLVLALEFCGQVRLPAERAVGLNKFYKSIERLRGVVPLDVAEQVALFVVYQYGNDEGW